MSLSEEAMQIPIFLQGFRYPASKGIPSRCLCVLAIFGRQDFHTSLYLAAISAFHQDVEGHIVFSHSNSKQFMRSLIHMYPILKRPTPVLDLSLVL